MNSVSPVWTDAEVELERVIALDQPEYLPIIILPVAFEGDIQGMSLRMRLSDDERAAIANGADLIITELTFGKRFTPLNFALCLPGQRPFED